MSLQHALLKVLSDGRFHSGEQLAGELSVTRAAVWKAIKVLVEKYGMDVHSVHGRGYCLANSIELLDESLIRSGMQYASELNTLEVHFSLESTNRYLMQKATQQEPGPSIVFAEHQSGGKGRRGRNWISPFSGNLYLSMLWRFGQVPAEISGLSLAIGVAVCRVLHLLEVPDLALKWPNDILCQERKLCGILIEMHGESNGPYAIVIGIGLNLYMNQQQASDIDQPWIALDEVLPDQIKRNRLAALLSDQLVQTMQQFAQSGLASFLSEWETLDVYRDKPVKLILADKVVEGVACGIDQQGALLIRQGETTSRYFSGEISLRAAGA